MYVRECELDLGPPSYASAGANDCRQTLVRKATLKRSKFPVEFHVQILVGSGLLQRLESPGGTVLRST